MHRRRARRHSLIARSLALVLAAATIVTMGTPSAIASPGDIFQSAAPAATDAAPAATPLQDGDVSVAAQTGALTWSFPIKSPPGHSGMEPHVSLNYSSQAPIYGSPLGAGWSLA